MAPLHKAIVTITDDVIKPDVDKRQWRALKLQNEMNILIISDPDTDKSAASMNVHIGHLSDPVDIPGLAHFCEHMVFLGSEKYPGENTYADFILSHGGNTNAYTGKEDTNFHYDVAPAAFKEALDIFAQFFLGPLFTESATARELNAVDNENEKNVKNDSWRIHQLQHSLSKQGHDYHKFGTGSKETLETIPKAKGLNVRDELLKFHAKYYSSNLMCLAVLCKESLDEMTNYVCDLFGNIINKRVKEPSWPEHPYGPDQLRKRVLAVPIKDIRKLSLIWPCDDLQQWWESMPEHYIGHLVGHEGKGSLLSALKAKGWVNSLCAGGSSGAKGFGFLVLRAELTEEGLKHVDDIITMAYQYINMMREAGPQERIVNEAKDLNLMNFKFKDNEKPLSIVMYMAECLRNYPLEEVLSGAYLWKKYDPDVIQKLMDKLVPENMMSLVISKEFAGQTDKIERWYEVEYKVEPHSEELEAKWKALEAHEDLHIPEPNAFIPHDFDLCERDPDNTKYPRIIKNTALTRCWFKQDDEYLLPKGNMTVAIRSPVASSSPHNANLTWMFIRLFNDAFAEYSYDAELTRLTYDLNTAHYGFLIKVGGYTDKLSVLLEKFLSTLTTFKPDEKRVNIFRDEYMKGLRNFEMAQPTTHAEYRLGLIVKEGGWTVNEMLECADEMTVENITSYIPQLLSRIHIETLVHGNFTVKSALSLVETVENTLVTNMKSKPLPQGLQTRARREAKLPDDCSFLYTSNNDVHAASCVYNYYQLGLEATENNMLLELLHQIIKDPCFNQLRTKEQLGYIVHAHIRRGGGIQGLQVVVQSSKHPDYVNHRIEAFLSTVKEYLENLTDKDYKKHVAGLVSARLTQPKKLKARHSSYWSEIVGEYYQFDRDIVETDFVQMVSQQQLVNFFLKNIADGAAQRHKLSIQIVSKGHRDLFTPADDEKDNYTEPLPKPADVIASHVDFKRGLPLFPLTKPAMEIPQITMSKL